MQGERDRSATGVAHSDNALSEREMSGLMKVYSDMCALGTRFERESGLRGWQFAAAARASSDIAREQRLFAF